MKRLPQPNEFNEIDIEDVEEYLRDGWIIMQRDLFDHGGTSIKKLIPQTVSNMRKIVNQQCGITTWLEKDGVKIDWGFLSESDNERLRRVYGDELVDMHEEYVESCHRQGVSAEDIEDYVLELDL